MYITSRVIKITEGKHCSRYKRKRRLFRNPRPKLPYKVSIIGGGVVRFDGRGD
jgi:hypothetical protein